MEYVRVVLVALNSLAFLALGGLSVRNLAREPNRAVRHLWAISAVGCCAVVVGSVQRLTLQAVAVDWLPDSVAGVVTGDIQVLQSLFVLTLATTGFVLLKKLGEDIDDSGRLADALLDRVRHVDVDKLNLTGREMEVLSLIGQGVTTDVELADALHISRSTVQSHVKHLFRKSGLRRRTDLIALAVLVGSATDGHFNDASRQRQGLRERRSGRARALR